MAEKNQVDRDVSLPDRRTIQHCPNGMYHSQFQSIKSLSMKSLPKQFQDPDVLKAILYLSDLTGLLTLSDELLTCFIVHQDFNRSFQKKCPCHLCRCEACEHLSSPCQNCKLSSELSSDASKTWVSFVARTSYAFAENKNVSGAKCLLWYDNLTDHSAVRNLHFCKVVKKDKRKNTCEILLVTHDVQTSDRIYKALDAFLKSSKVVKRKYKNSSHSLMAIPCHPHGISKCVYIESVNDGSGGVSETGGPFAGDACVGSLGAPKFTLKCQGLLTMSVVRVNKPAARHNTQ